MSRLPRIVTVAAATALLVAATLGSTQARAAPTRPAGTPAHRATTGVQHGLAGPAPAQWVWTARSVADQWVAFRKTFALRAAPAQAQLQVAADTKYWLWVNGAVVVFDGGLERGRDPHSTYVDPVPIARYLRPGVNAVTVLVWYHGKRGYDNNDSRHGGLLVTGTVTAGGVSTSLSTDASWRAVQHANYRHDTTAPQPNFRLSEWNVAYDARPAVMNGWTSPAYVDRSWPAAVPLAAAGGLPWGRLVARPIPLTRFGDPKPYVNAATLPKVSTGAPIIAKLPSNVQITPLLVVRAPAGALIRIRTDHYTDGGAPNVRGIFIASAGTSGAEILAWMSGTAVVYEIPRGIQIVSLTYRESNYASSITGTLATGDPVLDTLYRKAARTLFVNAREVWMSCPTRERAQWIGDVASEVQLAAYALSPTAGALGGEAFRALAGWQTPTGALLSPAPVGLPSELPQQELAAIWSMAQYYLYTGDRASVQAAYPAVARYLALYTLAPSGLVRHRAGTWDWHDWGPGQDVPLLDNAWFVLAASSAAELATLAGQPSDATSLRARIRTVKAAFDPAFWNATLGGYRSASGPAGAVDDRGNALAVVAGLVPVRRFAAVAAVLRTRRTASPYLELYVERAQYMLGDAGGAIARMKARYAANVADHGYTLWEQWTKAGGTDDHAWAAGPAFVLPAMAAGLAPTSAGWRSYQVAPQPGPLTRISASTATVLGRFTVAVSRSAAALHLTVAGPATARGTTMLPYPARGTVTVGGVVAVTAGVVTGAVRGVSISGGRVRVPVPASGAVTVVVTP